MKSKTIILIAWPVSVLFFGWLGCVVGTRIGTEVGKAKYHNEQVRTFQLDVTELAEQTDVRTRALLLATSKLAGQMSDPGRYAEEHREFSKTILKLQNNSIQGAVSSAPP